MTDGIGEARPRHKLNAVLGRRPGAVDWAVEGVYADERRDFGDVTLGSYALANARVAWPFASGWRLEARLDNAFGRDYELAYGFNTPGRSWLVAVAYDGR